MNADDPTSESQRPLSALDPALAGDNLDKELVKASVMAGLFQSIVEPTRVGRFTMIKRIGTGGMGEVYAAYDEQLDRKVAIKLVRPDAAHDASQRLVREAKVLARLSHPNVVQVYEAGTVADRVFLAMEFIRGQTLRQWLGQQDEVPEPQRRRSVLAMFLAAGRGLEAAHAAGLVHRDFKPENVLIGEDGRVCVADFGLARVEPGSQLADATPDATTGTSHRDGQPPRPTDNLTRSGMQMGTPSYMSPEQWQGRPSDSRSDQFSFCVALYEALYRVHPFAVRDRALLRKRVIAGQYKRPPQSAPVSARIWTILQRGLAVAPADRYPGMGELLDALVADPRQQWRRRMVAAVLLASGALAGIALHAASNSPKDPCARTGEPVAAIWSPGVAAHVRVAFAATKVPYARPTWQLIQPRIDEYARALRAARKETCEATYVRHEQSEELFDRKTVCLDRRERHLRALLDQLGWADDSVVEKSAEAVAALPSMAGCDDRENLLLGLQPPLEAEKKQVRAIRDALAEAHMQQQLGHRETALELANTQLRATAGLKYEPVRAEALHQVGFIMFRDGAGARDDVARAEVLLKDALDVAESNRHDELVNQIWLDLVLLGRAHHMDFTLVDDWARRAVATSRRLGDPDYRRQQLSAALCLRGAIYTGAGKPELAEQKQRDALQLIEDRPGVSPLARARCLHELAITLLARGRAAENRDAFVDEARNAFEKALTIQKAELGDGHPAIARLSFDMASALKEAGDFDGTRELLAQARTIWTSLRLPASQYAADVHLNLANLEQEVGDLEVAREHARLGREMYRQMNGADSPLPMHVEAIVAMVAFRGEHFAEALDAYERALKAQERARPKDPAMEASLVNNIAETLVMLGEPDRALMRIAEAEALLARAENVLPEEQAGLLKSRGLALLAKGNARAAIKPLEQALKRLEKSKQANPMEYAEMEWALARTLGKAGLEPGHARALAGSAYGFFQGQGRGQAGARTRKAIEKWLAGAH